MAVTGAAVATANAVPAVTQSRQRRRRGADATGDTHPRAVTAATDLKHQQRRRQQVHQGADDHLGRPRGCARHEQQGAEEGADSGGVRRRREQHGHWPVEQKVLKRKAASRQTDLGGGRGGGGGRRREGGGARARRDKQYNRVWGGNGGKGGGGGTPHSLGAAPRSKNARQPPSRSVQCHVRRVAAPDAALHLKQRHPQRRGGAARAPFPHPDRSANHLRLALAPIGGTA